MNTTTKTLSWGKKLTLKMNQCNEREPSSTIANKQHCTQPCRYSQSLMNMTPNCIWLGYVPKMLPTAPRGHGCLWRGSRRHNFLCIRDQDTTKQILNRGRKVRSFIRDNVLWSICSPFYQAVFVTSCQWLFWRTLPLLPLCNLIHRQMVA